MSELLKQDLEWINNTFTDIEIKIAIINLITNQYNNIYQK